MGKKRLAEAYILGIPFGLFGAHHFYLRRNVFGILYLCTLGLFGIGYLYDLVRMRWLVRHANRYGNDRKMITDCYLIGFLGGLFGAHHFYLGSKKLGILYLCTLGVFGVGWIVDLLRMHSLLEAFNSKSDSRSLGTAYILAFPPLGVFGAYHYYLGNWKLGLIYTLTLGNLGIGWIVDLFRMSKLVQNNGDTQKHSVLTAYIMAAPPFGLFGAHHYYLEDYCLGITYTCTLGKFGIGWIVDLFTMKFLVKPPDDKIGIDEMKKRTAYVWCVSPLGLFGAHHFYMKRYLNGGLYIATFGIFGIGWIFDMLRLPVLYERYATEDEHKYVDEAYIFWFPFGLFGLHQFYMGNKKWGILYACTFGCLGFGWLIDGLRLPSMVREFNKTVKKRDMAAFRICCSDNKDCSMFKCRSCYADLLTLFPGWEKRRKSRYNRNEAAEKEELSAMCELDNTSHLTDLTKTKGKTKSTVQDSYKIGMPHHDVVPVCGHVTDPVARGYSQTGEDNGDECQSMSESAD